MGRAVDFRALRSIIRNIIRNFEWTKELLTDPCRLFISRVKIRRCLREKSRAKDLKGPEIRALYWRKTRIFFLLNFITNYI
jgi:hypothetical protein